MTHKRQDESAYFEATYYLISASIPSDKLSRLIISQFPNKCPPDPTNEFPLLEPGQKGGGGCGAAALVASSSGVFGSGVFGQSLFPVLNFPYLLVDMQMSLGVKFLSGNSRKFPANSH